MQTRNQGFALVPYAGSTSRRTTPHRRQSRSAHGLGGPVGSPADYLPGRRRKTHGSRSRRIGVTAGRGDSVIAVVLASLNILIMLGKFGSWLRGKNDKPVETVASRFVRLFENLGVHRNQIPRFFGHSLELM